jgi:hypothetical protein
LLTADCTKNCVVLTYLTGLLKSWIQPTLTPQTHPRYCELWIHLGLVCSYQPLHLLRSIWPSFAHRNAPQVIRVTLDIIGTKTCQHAALNFLVQL